MEKISNGRMKLNIFKFVGKESRLKSRIELKSKINKKRTNKAGYRFWQLIEMIFDLIQNSI